MHRLILGFFALTLACCSHHSAKDEEVVRTFLGRYFSTWSAQDMEGYAGCFHEQARISFVTKQGVVQSQGLTDFIHGQKMAHQTSSSPMKEVPLAMKIELHAPVAQAAVNWKLTKSAGGEETGMDFFTLVKTAEGWRIMSLVFYND
jgi:hypothetical protein